MKTRIFYIFLFIIFAAAEMKSQVTIGEGVDPDGSALLDIKNQPDGSSDKGLLLPRIGIANATQFGLTGNSGTEGMVAYNTTANANNSGKGLYYWNGTGWIKLQGSDSQLNWTLNGNTNGSLKALGTKDAFDIPVITNNIERMRITSGGSVGIGTTTPKARFSVSGGVISQDDFTAGDKFFLLGSTNSAKITLNTNSNLSFYAGTLTQADGTTPFNVNSGYYVWNVADVSNAWREIIRLTNDGKLGVGIATPQATLHVAGTALMEHDMKVLTLPQASPIDNALVADTNGVIKLTTTPIPQRSNYTMSSIAPGGTGSITRPTYSNYTTAYYTLTISITNTCGDVAIVNLAGYNNVLSFIGGQAQGVNYNFTEGPDIASLVLTVNLPTPCVGATSSQFNFSIGPNGKTLTITNNGTTALNYNLSVTEF